MLLAKATNQFKLPHIFQMMKSVPAEKKRTHDLIENKHMVSYGYFLTIQIIKTYQYYFRYHMVSYPK